MSGFTKAQLVEIWKRPVETQYSISISKLLEGINLTDGRIAICFSGGKDSALLLDMYCEIIKTTRFARKPIIVYFANTTNETGALLDFVSWFIPFMERKHSVRIKFREVKPPNGLTWAEEILTNGIPLISKEQSKAIRYIRRDMVKTGCDYDTVCRLAKPDMKCVNELKDIGFTASGILSLTGYVTSKDFFGKCFVLSKRWIPMIDCEIPLSELCCVHIKEAALSNIGNMSVMTGEQASESKKREATWLKTGCTTTLPSGLVRSKPFGAMTLDGVLFALKYRQTPICSDYGEIVSENGHYRCTKAQRTGCALCGFGCHLDTERFIRLQETEPAKVRFAFKPRAQGGAGYLEAIQHMNEYCGTDVKIPVVQN